MEIRPVRPEDNERLIALSRSTPMIGQISVFMDRSPDYFAFYDLYGDCMMKVPAGEFERLGDPGWISVCTEDQGRLVGVVAMGSKLVNYEGEVLRVSYPSDARISPDYQHKGVVKNMGRYLNVKWGSAPTDLMIGYIIEGNFRAREGFEKGIKEVVTGVHAGDFHMIQLSLYKPYGNGKFKIERATESDVPEIIGLLADFYSDYHFSPIFNEQTWKHMMARCLGYSVNDIRLVRENGKIQALIGLWDQGAIRKVVLTQFPSVIKWGIRIAKGISLFLNSPEPPKVNEPQTSLYIKHIAHRPGKLDLLRALMKSVTNEVRISRKHHYIWGAFYDTDPLFTIFDRMLVTETKSGQYYAPWNTGWFKTPAEIESRPCFADFSMV